ncbi:hypothetical protein C7S14_0119 [Burkholderia cepacia]|nr:hypothetical protein C7S14_0119 [Burkholderia cepacia]
MRFRLNRGDGPRFARAARADEIVYAHKLKFLIFLSGAGRDGAR